MECRPGNHQILPPVDTTNASTDRVSFTAARMTFGNTKLDRAPTSVASMALCLESCTIGRQALFESKTNPKCWSLLVTLARCQCNGKQALSCFRRCGPCHVLAVDDVLHRMQAPKD